MNWWEIEQAYYSNDIKTIGGVDEAGRGPLCGSVYAACVILPKGLIIDKLNDSKKLSEKTREELFDIIVSKAEDYGIGHAAPAEIDDINILNATFLAMSRAVNNLRKKPELLLIDGNRIKGMDIRCECIIKGDQKSANIAAASVLAKVSRDREMRRLDKIYPQYNLAQHKGYGTKAHVALIKEHGINELYRKSFLNKIFGDTIG